MKNIFKIAALAVLFITGVSCENDDQMIVSNVGGPELLTPVNGSSYVLSPATPTAEATTLVWNHANYSIQTEVNYTIEVAVAGTEFATIISGGTTTNRFATWTVEAFNAVALQAGLIPFSVGQLDIRIKSALGTNAELVDYSNVVTVSVKPFSTELPKIAVPGNHQGWAPPVAPVLASSGYGQTDYEGYVWLNGAFKFLAPNASGAFAWGSPDWGDDGTFSGVLKLTDESNCSVSTAGYYRVKANTTTLLYSVAPVSWGIIGAATPTGWDSDTDFDYNSTTKKLEIASIALVPGNFKFRGNNAWSNGFDYGTVNADGYLVEGGDLTFNGAAGNYKVVLDLSNPRKYTYSITAN